MKFLFPILLLVSALTVTGQSQQRAQKDGDSLRLDEFLVEGGRTNRIEGDVERISYSNAVNALKSNEVLDNGDTIQSSASGRAEILLVPGYYLRLDHNTRINLRDLSPENLKLKLWRGAAVLEVPTNDTARGNDFWEVRKRLSYEPVSLLAPDAQYIVTSGGSYRLEVNASGGSRLRVMKGLAFVNGSRVDKGMIASVDRGEVNLSSMDKSEDEFDLWSRERAKVLVKANQSLSKSHWYKQLRSNRGYLLISDPADADRARERLTVSAETGVVELAESAVVSGSSDSSWRRLQAGERLSNGDRVRTSVESRVEVHVYPTCFVFLEGDTEIVYRESEGQPAVEVIKGSVIAILTPDANAAEPAALTVIADKTEHRISDEGNYRINIIPGAQSKLLVYDETSRVPISQFSRPKKSRNPDRLEADIPINKLTGDSFDLWSYLRSKRQQIRGLRRYFGPTGGMWYLVEATGEYTFVPARWQFSSPYGGNYSITFAEDSSFKRKRPMRPPVDTPLGKMRPDKLP